ncbi:hypothetical protein [Candidatus Mycoplasma haematominutum]|uniref:Uncharacterized protein n=1 Tax=Candidatus Mycoplasma haematominutum 'Birmingham 1' TaxID=1116213 RepID=G8C2Q1_9MOLU|nr:hypothetical protein [Candidatus Mycoplasma haematominutum]CCE66599.1 hypothetical protein MHM_00810 [Candidatus Mycoplasma haematominutum 'Birmingham 1']
MFSKYIFPIFSFSSLGLTPLLYSATPKFTATQGGGNHRELGNNSYILGSKSLPAPLGVGPSSQSPSQSPGSRKTFKLKPASESLGSELEAADVVAMHHLNGAEYSKMISELYIILGATIWADASLNRSWVEKLALSSPKKELEVVNIEPESLGATKSFYSISTKNLEGQELLNQRKKMQQLFYTFFNPSWAFREEGWIMGNEVETSLEIIGDAEVSELIFHRIDGDERYYLSIVFNAPLGKNSIYTEFRDRQFVGKDNTTPFDRDFAEMFLFGNTKTLYRTVHSISKCIQDWECATALSSSKKILIFNEGSLHPLERYYRDYKQREELCRIISKMTSESNSCLILS